jgi:hypothetical protein
MPDQSTPDYTDQRDTELRQLFVSVCTAEPLVGGWPELVKFARAVAAAEREACAKECEQIADDCDQDWGQGKSDPSDPDTALYCAAACRARRRIDE